MQVAFTSDAFPIFGCAHGLFTGYMLHITAHNELSSSVCTVVRVFTSNRLRYRRKPYLVVGLAGTVAAHGMLGILTPTLSSTTILLPLASLGVVMTQVPLNDAIATGDGVMITTLRGHDYST